jgi:branched-chain amino acid transport system substrate-binding protein
VPLGRDLVNGASLAAAEVNDAGGLLGHRVRLDVQDDGCTPLTAAQAATRLVDQKVVGVVGGVCNDASRAAVETLGKGDTPTIVSSANADALVGSGLPFSFLVNGTVYQEGLAAAHWIAYRSAQRVAVVADASQQSRELSRVVSHGIDAPLVGTQTLRSGHQSLGRVAATTLRTRPDFVYWAGSAQDGGRLVRELRAQGYRGSFMASSSSDSPAFVAAAGNQAAEGAFITTTARPDLLPAAASWAVRYREKYHQEPGRTAMQAYDALRTLVQAVRQAGNTQPRAIADNIMRLRGFSTFMGELQFAPDHTMTDDNYVIARVHKGAIMLDHILRTD